MRHQCNLAAKESGLGCTCVNSDDFTVLVGGSGRLRWVSMDVYCVSPHSKWLSEYSNEYASYFLLSLNIPLWKLLGWFIRLQLWATGDWQFHHNNAPTHASHLIQFFGETSNHPGDSAPLQPRCGALWLLPFPKIKITFEREAISDHWWDSVNTTGQLRSQDAYFEGDWGVIVLWTTFLVSCIFFSKVSVVHIIWLDASCTDLMSQRKKPEWPVNILKDSHL